ncbi:hypothetical protein D3C72_2042680 [compost metagenome]
MQGVAGGEDEHRHRRTCHIGAAQAARQLQAVHGGQANVDDGGVERLCAQHLFRALATAHPVHGIARIGQAQLDAAGHHDVVFDQ